MPCTSAKFVGQIYLRRLLDAPQRLDGFALDVTALQADIFQLIIRHAEQVVEGTAFIEPAHDTPRKSKKGPNSRRTGHAVREAVSVGHVCHVVLLFIKSVSEAE